MKKKKTTEEFSSINMTGFAQPVMDGTDYPEERPVDLQFYTKKYVITADDKKRLCALVMNADFRIFEKYIDWRVNASAHKMKTHLMNNEPQKAGLEAAEIDALAKISADMANFWNEVKLMEVEDEVLIRDRTPKPKKIYGEDSYGLSSVDETV